MKALPKLPGRRAGLISLSLLIAVTGIVGTAHGYQWARTQAAKFGLRPEHLKFQGLGFYGWSGLQINFRGPRTKGEDGYGIVEDYSAVLVLQSPFEKPGVVCFWFDDSPVKINVNTAGEATVWDEPTPARFWHDQIFDGFRHR